jgi:hypothetical protein
MVATTDGITPFERIQNSLLRCGWNSRIGYAKSDFLATAVAIVFPFLINEKMLKKSSGSDETATL